MHEAEPDSCVAFTGNLLDIANAQDPKLLLQPMLRHLEVHICALHFNVMVRMAPVGVNDMDALHVVPMYGCNVYCELAVILS